MDSERQLAVRLAQEADLPQVTELWRQLVQHHVACDDRITAVAPGGAERWQSRLRGLLSDQTCRLYVADAGLGGALVGFASGFLQYAPQVFEPQLSGLVADIFVVPQWRRRGVARRLLSALTAWFAGENVDHIELSVVDRNESATGFWKDVGALSFTSRLWMPVDWQETRSK